MGIKSDKTFEEIVERLVALFQGQHEDGVTDAHAQRSSIDSARSAESADHNPAASALPIPAEDDAAS